MNGCEMGEYLVHKNSFIVDQKLFIENIVRACGVNIEDWRSAVQCVYGLRAENTYLRAALAVSKDPCLYCQLPADEMAKCKLGFPGCGRADDMTGCPEFGASMQVKELVAENAELKRDKERLDWLCDPAKVYFVQIQSQPSGDYVFRSGPTLLRSVIDAAREKP